MLKLSLKMINISSVTLSVLLCAASATAEIQKITLNNGRLQTEITPDIGGRLLSVSLVGKPNFLRLGEPVISNPDPVVSPESENVGYLGHEIWVGPQSEWWIHQSLNTKRAAEKATWPPDPYLILAKNTVLEQSAQKVVLQNPPSPISGLQLTKSYSFIKNKKNSLQLNVTAKNNRSDNVAWDIWFNTRTYSNTQVYIPVADVNAIRLNNIESETMGPLEYSLNGGIFSLDILPPPKGKVGRRGKVLIQPSQGWMAGFHGEQVLIIQFAHQEKSAIHPEQGQVELYNEYRPNDLNEGLLEMEVHAPYKTLAAGEVMNAQEVWTLLEYKGDSSRNAQIAFLRKNAKELGITF